MCLKSVPRCLACTRSRIQAPAVLAAAVTQTLSSAFTLNHLHSHHLHRLRVIKESPQNWVYKCLSFFWLFFLHFTISGCMYDGHEHTEGSSWFADSNDCMNCMCVGGVTTCSEIRCLSPCVNTIRVAGECCPVCAGEELHPGQYS